MADYKWYRVSPKYDSVPVYNQYDEILWHLRGEWDVKGQKFSKFETWDGPDWYFFFESIGQPPGYMYSRAVNVTDLQPSALDSDEAQIALTNLLAQTKKALADASALVERLEDLNYLIRQHLGLD